MTTPTQTITFYDLLARVKSLTDDQIRSDPEIVWVYWKIVAPEVLIHPTHDFLDSREDGIHCLKCPAILTPESANTWCTKPDPIPPLSEAGEELRVLVLSRKCKCRGDKIAIQASGRNEPQNWLGWRATSRERFLIFLGTLMENPNGK